ncbi:hypothetical protein F2Q68_00020229 [Brassica cretica]|uniref:Uncharacterized protein n=1 Tax=Brassica cretica TaxID=69181 RepID=A0A8S9FRA4_BRACR|nr:hypothetical protein F2Q68_00020229 [Brassica cretica]
MKDHAHAEALISPIDGTVQGFWDPIPVSPDTVETTTEFAGDDEELNYPADAFGASLSRNFNFDLARPRFTLGFKVCAVTSWLSIFLLRFLPDSYRFKVRDRFTAYMTCMRAFVLVLDVRRSKERSSCVCLRWLMCSSGQIDERGVRFLWSRSDSLFASSRLLTLATSRSYFEDYTYIFGAEERLFCDFGPYEAADKSLNVCRFFKRVLRLLR